MSEIKVIKKIDLPQEGKKPTAEDRAQKLERDTHKRLDGIGKRLTDQHEHMSSLESRLLEALAQLSQLRATSQELKRLERERQAQSQILKTLREEDSKRSRVLEVLEGRLQAVEEQSKRQADGYRKILDTRLAQLQSYDSTLTLMKHIVIGMAILYVASMITLIIL